MTQIHAEKNHKHDYSLIDENCEACRKEPPFTGPDARIENHGSICIVQPLTATAREWLQDNVSRDSQWWAGGLVVEPRYLSELLDGMISDGLSFFN